VTIYTCGLCSHTYDTEKEAVSWDNLPDNWVCPVCGSPKSEFNSAGDNTTGTTPSADTSSEEQVFSTHQCGLCSHIYDEAVEGVEWADLPEDWVCPLCGSGKAEFHLLSQASTAAETTQAGAASDAVEDEYLGEWRRAEDTARQ
jgi:methylamine---glutamate N-methyltransferase subunit C